MADGVGLVWAQSRDGVIGLDGTIPWHLPEDLAHFRALTWGGVVVMGRRTWCTLPAAVRPLPGRRCLVLSRRPGFVAAGASVHADLASALADAARDGAPVWVMGGEQVYAEALPQASRVVATEVDLEIEPPTDLQGAGGGRWPGPRFWTTGGSRRRARRPRAGPPRRPACATASATCAGAASAEPSARRPGLR